MRCRSYDFEIAEIGYYKRLATNYAKIVFRIFDISRISIKIKENLKNTQKNNYFSKKRRLVINHTSYQLPGNNTQPKYQPNRFIFGTFFIHCDLS